MKSMRLNSLAAASSVAVLLAMAGWPATGAAQASGAAASASGTVAPATGEQRDPAAGIRDAVKDAKISGKVNAGLSVDKRLSAAGIEVDTEGAVVTLKGKAPSQEAKERAGEIARYVQGVTEVRNELQVEQQASTRSGGGLRALVPRDVNDMDRSQDASSRQARPGSPDTAAARDPATSMGAAGAGSAGAPADASASSSGLGTAVTDITITTKVNTGLSVDKHLSATRIDVDTKNGVVTLRGSAPSEEARQRAAEIARHVDKVKEVNNELKVVPGSS